MKRLLAYAGYASAIAGLIVALGGAAAVLADYRPWASRAELTQLAQDLQQQVQPGYDARISQLAINRALLDIQINQALAAGATAADLAGSVAQLVLFDAEIARLQAAQGQ